MIFSFYHNLVIYAAFMAKIKGVTSKKVREEFPHLRHLPSLWTRGKKQGGETYGTNDNN